MHEFSLCQSLLTQAFKVAPVYFKQQTGESLTHGNIVITALTIRLGLFSGVDKHLLKRAFDAALLDVHRKWTAPHNDNSASHRFQTSQITEDAPPHVVFAPFAQLIIEEASTIVYCQECDQHFSVTQKQYREAQLTCRNNPHHKTKLISGDDMLLVNLKMHIEDIFPPLNQLFQTRAALQG